MGKVKLVKLILPQAEIEKLTAKDKKRYVMFTSMLRDLNLLQKCLVFVGNVDSSDTPSKSAKTTIAFFFLKTLISKIHEMGVFLEKTKVVESVGSLNDVRGNGRPSQRLFWRSES